MQLMLYRYGVKIVVDNLLKLNYIPQKSLYLHSKSNMKNFIFK